MNTDILKEHMTDFQKENLKSYIEKDVLNSLLEWQSYDETTYTRDTMAEIILTIKGKEIFKEKRFRKDLLKTFSKEKILSFRKVLPMKYSQVNDLNQLVDVISNQNWKKSKVTEYFLEILGIEVDEIFPEIKDDEHAINEIKSDDIFYELFDYQYVIRQKVLTKLGSSDENEKMLIHMPTGTGKTKTAAHIMCQHYNENLKRKGLIIWVAHTNELLGQAYETFCNVWKHIGNGSIKAYKLWGDFNIDPKTEDFNGVMFCGIYKLLSIEKNNKQLYDRLKKETKLIVYDEAHKASATETRKVLMDFMQNNESKIDLVGLSATPGRKQGYSIDNNLLQSTFGGYEIDIDTKLMNEVNYSRQKAINIKPEKDIIKYFQERGILAKIKKEELTYDKDISEEDMKRIKVIKKENGDIDFSDSTLKIIGKNKNRNLRIIEKIQQLNRENIPTIVFACSVKHAQLLSAMLNLNGIKNSLIIGNMGNRERKDAIEKFKDKNSDVNVIINYEVLTTGFDSTNIKCVLIARPTQSIVLYSQMIGRGLRGPKMGGNEECLLIDIKDNLQKYNENMAFSHFDNYWKE